MSYKWNPLTSKLDRIVGKDEVKDSMIDWGTGTDQVSSSDMPDHNSHTVRDTFTHSLNRGKCPFHKDVSQDGDHHKQEGKRYSKNKKQIIQLCVYIIQRQPHLQDIRLPVLIIHGEGHHSQGKRIVS